MPNLSDFTPGVRVFVDLHYQTPRRLHGVVKSVGPKRVCVKLDEFLYFRRYGPRSLNLMDCPNCHAPMVDHVAMGSEPTLMRVLPDQNQACLIPLTDLSAQRWTAASDEVRGKMNGISMPNIINQDIDMPVSLFPHSEEV